MTSVLRSGCAGSDTSDTEDVCHDRYGYSSPGEFRRRACTLCHEYLFPSDRPAYVAVLPDYVYLMSVAAIRGASSNWSGHDPREVGSFNNCF